MLQILVIFYLVLNLLENVYIQFCSTRVKVSESLNLDVNSCSYKYTKNAKYISLLLFQMTMTLKRTHLLYLQTMTYLCSETKRGRRQNRYINMFYQNHQFISKYKKKLTLQVLHHKIYVLTLLKLCLATAQNIYMVK